MLTTLGLLLFAAVVLALITPISLTRVLAASAGIPVGVSVVAAGNSLTLFYSVGLGIAAAQIWQLLHRRRHLDSGRPARFPGSIFTDRPGSRALLTFVAYSMIITLVAPTIFAGIPVLVSRGGLDSQLVHPGRLAYSVSNIAQAMYVVLGACIIIFIAHSRKTTAGTAGLPLATLTILSAWRLVHREFGLWFPEHFFDNSTNVRYVESTPTGEMRFRGIYSEPSGLAEGSLATLVFFAARLPYLRGRQRLVAVVIMLLAAYNGSVSTSATFVLASVVLGSIILIVGLVGFTVRSARLGRLAAAIGCVLVCVGAFLTPALINLVNSVVAEKVASTSYTSRSGVDIFSIGLLLQTWGLGTGVGSNRPSSMIASVFSCTGLIGGLAYFTFMAVVVVKSWPYREYRATVWAFGATIISKMIAGPAMLDPIPAVFLGVLAAVAWRQTAREENSAAFEPAASSLAVRRARWTT